MIRSLRELEGDTVTMDSGWQIDFQVYIAPLWIGSWVSHFRFNHLSTDRAKRVAQRIEHCFVLENSYDCAPRTCELGTGSTGARDFHHVYLPGGKVINTAACIEILVH